MQTRATVVLLFAFLLPSFAQACECLIAISSLDYQIRKHEQIFIGRVLSKNADVYPLEYQFEVLKSWKGVSEKQVRIVSGAGGADCGMDFEPGQEYIVYADAQRTTYCTRTALRRLSTDEELLDLLFHNKPLAETLSAAEVEHIQARAAYFQQRQLDLRPNDRLAFVKDYRCIGKVDFYGIHPLEHPQMDLFILTEKEKRKTGAQVDKVLVMGGIYPLKKYNRKKVLRQLRRQANRTTGVPK